MSSPETQASDNRFRFLADAVAWRYRTQGIAIRWQVRAKLLRDPFYRTLAASDWLPKEGRILDLGCGRGELLALAASARSLGMAQDRKRGPQPSLTGIEACPRLAASAQLALSGLADIIAGDVRQIDLPPCRTAVLDETLLHFAPEEQDRLLERVTAALEPGGSIILREPDAGGLLEKTALRLATGISSLFQRQRGLRPYPRGAKEWNARLESLGLRPELHPAEDGIWPGKPWIAARKPETVPI